ncbi:hypothetical protein CPAR01_05077 [Colletotrichum paranaense]|uniref:Uncharacterized protein n=1 Tax=Colletotrichum paranaense TaxID=1914294 RepID=A0ABQ9SQ93_9PEZI|nr:uncharacterized protein CPAR01_05077 [Colletotrichum paranaense]KAK1541690.1 hypothetical protein CPAR01_05077 [Colletotrichum paranaense]
MSIKICIVVGSLCPPCLDYQLLLSENHVKCVQCGHRLRVLQHCTKLVAVLGVAPLGA